MWWAPHESHGKSSEPLLLSQPFCRDYFLADISWFCRMQCSLLCTPSKVAPLLGSSTVDFSRKVCKSLTFTLINWRCRRNNKHEADVPLRDRTQKWACAPFYQLNRSSWDFFQMTFGNMGYKIGKTFLSFISFLPCYNSLPSCPPAPWAHFQNKSPASKIMSQPLFGGLGQDSQLQPKRNNGIKVVIFFFKFAQ